MRRSGVLSTARGLGVHDHAGWVFSDPAEFRADAARFLAEGLSAGQRVVCVASDSTLGLPELAGLDAALATGQARIASVDRAYAVGQPVDAQRQLAAFAQASDTALADGWAGLRVVADVTSLVLTPQQREAWTHYEYLVDRYIAHLPLSGLCGFNSRVLTDEGALTEVVSMHPAVNAGASRFRMYGGDGVDVSIALAGEIDLNNRAVFASALRRARPAPVGDTLVVDASRLTFIDHRGLTELAGYAAEVGLTTMVYTAEDTMLSRLIHILSIPGVQVTSR